MKYQWYIVDCDEGIVVGTNDVEQAKPFLTDDRYIILTAQHGAYFCGKTEHQVEEIDAGAKPDEDEEDDDDGGEDDEDEDDLI